MSAEAIVLIGGPMDGCIYTWPEGNDIMVVAQPVNMPAMMLHADLAGAAEVIPTIEHAYLRDPALTWRFIYRGERQR